MEVPRNIIIIGAGIAGISCALALSRELTPFVPGLSITVFERYEILSTSGGAINITPSAQRHLAQLGILQELDRMGGEGGVEVESIELYSARSGHSMGSIDFVDHHGNGYGGYKGRRVMRIMLSIAMLTVVDRTPNVNIVFGKKVIGGEELDGKAVVKFEDESEFVGDLVIGCDGVHSRVRTHWVDPDCPSQYTGISFLQANIETKSLTSPIHFRSSAMNMSRHGSFLTTFVDEGHEQIFTAAMVEFSQKDLESHHLVPGQDWVTQNKIRSNLRKKMRGRFGDSKIPCIREMVENDTDWMLYPVYQVPTGGKWFTDRVILLGDAAHAMPPRDESASYALDDAILFARIMACYRSEPLCEVFDAYENLRRSKINHAFKESGRMWGRNRDMGLLEGRLKEWTMPLYLRAHKHERKVAWEFDANQTQLPTPAPSEGRMSTESFFRKG